MTEQESVEVTQNQYSRKRRVVLFISIPVIFLLLLLLFFYLEFSGVFEKTPTVEVRAENVYDKTLHVVTDKDYEPFFYIDENGENTGLDVELMNEIANRLHCNLDLQLLDWTEANQRFQGGEAYIILNMETDLVANDHRLTVTIPTAEKQYVVYGRQKVSSVVDLYGKRIVSLHQLPALGLDDEITYLDSYEKIFEALGNGEYDFAVCPIQVGNIFLERMNQKDIHPSYAVSHVYGALALKVEHTELKNQINEVIRELEEEGFLEKLDHKWVRHRYVNASLFDILESHPGVGAGMLIAFFVTLIMGIGIFFQYRSVVAKDAYTKKLQENIEMIEKQRRDLKEQQEILIEAKQRAEEENRAKTTFLSNMSHDIRTPMNAIIGYTNLAKRSENSIEQLHDYLNKIGASSEHLLALINDVLEMSRIESGKMELEETETDLCKVLEEVRDMFATQMEKKQIGFSVDTSEVKDSYVLCDKNRIDRVLLNLISNAYKFTPEGGTVSVRLSQLNGAIDGFGRYELRVKDSGIGMTEKFAEKVFEAFERERNTTVSGIQGTGLGMAITKNIIDLMGGEISVVTAPQKGTEFIIHIQCKLLDQQEMPESVQAKTKSEEQMDFSKMRLLLVEDMEVNRQIALMILRQIGFMVETAVNGKEAVEKIADSVVGYYDAVLMDIQMPVMNGYEAAREIRSLQEKELSDIPIIAMTANAFQEDVQEALNAGMNGHIAKPIDEEKLKETLERILKQR